MNKRPDTTIFKHKCIDFSIIGYKHIKSLNIKNLNVKLKRHFINESNNQFSPFHFYIELQHSQENRKFKIVIDCESDWNYDVYKSRFKPKDIKEIKETFINNAYILINDLEFKEQVINSINYYLKVNRILIN